jgi:hypothetical protein
MLSRRAFSSVAAFALPLAACVAGSGGAGDDAGEPSPEPEPEPDCLGDALLDDVPISDDFDALRARWDLNKQMLHVLFLGEPS